MGTEKRFTLSGDFNIKKAALFAFALLVTLVIWNLPVSCFGIEGLNVIQQRIIAVFAFATILWVTEAISPWATSVSLIGLLLFSTSDNAFTFFRSGMDKSELLDHSALMATFADPIIILFLGGFILAIAATKSGLDVLLARTLLKPFGKKSENVLLGFILITGFFSMFVSNTATAAMMLTFLTPVFKALPPEGKGRIALTLSIPVAANIGGIGWFLLKKFFPFKKKTIDLNIEGEVEHNWRTVVVAVTFVVTVLLWICDRWTGVGANTVAMLPIVVFAFTGVIKARDLQEINWSVIWMVAGGFALGLALNESGLAENVIKSIPFGNWSPVAILLASGVICYILSNFISNTATAALLVPILAVVCKGMGGALDSIGGTPTVLIGIAIAASVAMSLPISTPPNAIAHSTGLVKQNEMMKIGLIMGIIGLVLGYAVLFAIGEMGLLKP